ncbi:hypothetical protein B0H19DRAFT_1064253 [Mycena capillaripes]|nr:hypothetical protein B0H19DRAFT_1064253 [Mycena capillaripes]
MDGYRGVPAAVRGTAGTRCLTSAARTLRGGTPFSTLRNHSGPRHAFPAASDPKVTIDVVCWPCTVCNIHLRAPRGVTLSQVDDLFDPPGYPTPAFKIKNNEVIRYATRLAAFHLTFPMDVPAQGLMRSQADPPPFPADYQVAPGDELDAQLWTLLNVHRRVNVYTIGPHPTIQDGAFGYTQFKKDSSMFNVLAWVHVSAISLVLWTDSQHPKRHLAGAIPVMACGSWLFCQRQQPAIATILWTLTVMSIIALLQQPVLFNRFLPTYQPQRLRLLLFFAMSLEGGALEKVHHALSNGPIGEIFEGLYRTLSKKELAMQKAVLSVRQGMNAGLWEVTYTMPLSLGFHSLNSGSIGAKQGINAGFWEVAYTIEMPLESYTPNSGSLGGVLVRWCNANLSKQGINAGFWEVAYPIAMSLESYIKNVLGS